MRAEKKYLIEEVAGHLKKSDYVILANYDRMTVADVAELRRRLEPHNAEFHVVKNSSLHVAAQALSLPDFDRALVGPTAIIVGGKNSPGVAKVLRDFIREMPSLDTLRAQLLGLLQQPATLFVRVVNAVPQGMVNVLQAKVRAAEGK
jgi:large subunit ribosomal protein L10